MTGLFATPLATEHPWSTDRGWGGYGPGDVVTVPGVLTAVREYRPYRHDPPELLLYSRTGRDLSGLRSLEAMGMAVFAPGSRFAVVHRYQVTDDPTAERILLFDVTTGGPVSPDELDTLRGELVGLAGLSAARADELLDFLARVPTGG
ncbi:hypothetical protein K1T35_00625 [Pseudonocardia sp. DSM 110487]|uniref:hypothetical protein n=1 Tax=Pseudonocardia sp. DSM 110487 TaxID=2865833 RepID=UPI001C6A666A|nr:hypothetical protein [Pseudonocardia sp. DSM 110487]QYN35909.1 hypothetical protein K1T35_00625 [Pseudonocardia sp. DSM 110487]